MRTQCDRCDAASDARDAALRERDKLIEHTRQRNDLRDQAEVVLRKERDEAIRANIVKDEALIRANSERDLARSEADAYKKRVSKIHAMEARSAQLVEALKFITETYPSNTDCHVWAARALAEYSAQETK